MIAAETYIELMTSPAHIAAECTIELISTLIGIVIGRFWLRRHDRHVHGKEAA